MGRIKRSPADFIVEEKLGFEADGEGEHLLLQIRKCQLSTDDVARDLKLHFGAGDVDVSYSGLKDKQAVTEQWFSVRTPMNIDELPKASGTLHGEAFESSDSPAWSVVSAGRHGRKLRRGAHKRNRFAVRLTELTSPRNQNEAPAEQVCQLVQHVLKKGFPNYFGLQRFGIEGANLRRAQQYFQNPRRKITRTQRGFCLSAARSALFNRVCAERVKAGTYVSPQLGEPMMLQGSMSHFINDGSDNTLNRCTQHDIHPSGPMWGRGEPIGEEPYLTQEANCLQEFSLFQQGLEKAGLKQERRALRAVAHQLHCEIEDDTTVLLTFELDKSAYATVMVAELIDTLTTSP